MNNKSSFKKSNLIEVADHVRYRVIGIIVILLGLSSFFFFANGVDTGLTSTFGLKSGSGQNLVAMPDMVLPSFLTALIFSILCVFFRNLPARHRVWQTLEPDVGYGGTVFHHRLPHLGGRVTTAST